MRVSLKGLSVVEICVHRRSFYGGGHVAEHKRRRWSFAASLKVERAARKLEENLRNVVVLVRASLKGLSIVESCVHRRSF